MPLLVPDTLSRQLQEVRAPPRRPLRLYVCGPTVYDVAHVGHARTYLYFDLVRRWFDAHGVAVRHVMNITDFEDKITARAAEVGTTWCALARREERAFLRDMRRLKIRPPHETPRASEFVPQMVRTIRRLERRRALERRPDGWFFIGDRPSVGRNFEVAAELIRHAVPEPGAPPPPVGGSEADFLVWKPQEPPAPSWPSPWGPGMPGWHLECFAMAEEYLSLPVDLHGGGRDLVYPHHYAENVVAYALTGRPFSRLFLHTSFVTANGTKMAKSTANLVPLRTALQQFGPDGLRWYLLGRPLTESIEWRDAEAQRANEEHARVRTALRRMVTPGGSGTLRLPDVVDLAGAVDAAVADQLGADRAFRLLRQYLAECQRAPNPRFSRGDGPKVRAQFRRIGELLGVDLL